MVLRARLLMLFLVLVGAGPGCRSLSEPSGEEPSVQSAPPTPDKPAVLEGHVRLAPGHELPAYPASVMERQVLTHTEKAPLPDLCSPPKVADRQPVQLTPQGLLTGVMVGASEFSHSTRRPPQVHEVVIEDCRLKPSLVVAVQGDVLRIRNAVDYPFMPMYGKSSLAQTLTPAQSRDVKLDKGGVEPVLCGFTAPCGRTDVVVVYHALNAITDASGRFRIEGVPVDEDFKLSVWHPLFEELTLGVRVGKGETKSLELELTPLPARVAAAQAPKGKGALQPGTGETGAPAPGPSKAPAATPLAPAKAPGSAK